MSALLIFCFGVHLASYCGISVSGFEGGGGFTLKSHVTRVIDGVSLLSGLSFYVKARFLFVLYSSAGFSYQPSFFFL